jgi:alkylation response protein AidB-like acyl-CoA dehydrogenase
MDFVFSEEQEELRRVVRAFLDDMSPVSEVRRLMETAEGYDPSVWDVIAGQLGLPGMAVPERWGGSGFGILDLVLVFEEAGRSLLCAPLLASAVLAAGALLCSGDEDACDEWLPALAAGEVIGTLAVCEDGGWWDEAGVALVAAPASGGSWSLDGTKSYVVDGLAAGLLLVAARTAEGVGLFAVAGDAPGLGREPLGVMDLTRKLARLTFSGTPARLVGEVGAGWTPVERALALAAAALGAEQVGGAQQCLDMTVAHARTRVQFDRPIGSFQAIKHKCADVLVAVEEARSAAYYAGWAADRALASGAAGAGGDPAAWDECLLAASLARAACSPAYLRAAGECVQVHGALGFTWEHDAHLYLKRAKASSLLFGDPAYHRDLLGRRLGL